MMTVEQYNGLKAGDIIENPPLFPGLSKEPLVAFVMAADQEKVSVAVSYFDVPMGLFAVALDGKDFVWEEITE